MHRFKSACLHERRPKDRVLAFSFRAGRSFRKLHPQDPPYVLTQNLIVMEYCDLGSVWGKVEKGFFHHHAEDGVVSVSMPRLLQVSCAK